MYEKERGIDSVYENERGIDSVYEKAREQDSICVETEKEREGEIVCVSKQERERVRESEREKELSRDHYQFVVFATLAQNHTSFSFCSTIKMLFSAAAFFFVSPRFSDFIVKQHFALLLLKVII